MSDEDFIRKVVVTNQIDYRDWDFIKNGPLFLEFLRNRTMCFIVEDAKNENGDPAFWDVVEWVEENAGDLWYLDNYSFYFYAPEDAVAFKLRWT